ncbi:hypothetical protein BCR33DRAFT_713681 [Rhizoclosmatium globosum]|uniref:ABC-type glycine betaine transport system substrate-binding domain-containing protein n=1 Tax=Rhizoclosmatium globosum TaxID=329046 RepID=A0A1Y2CQK7_9FUNG|nr:hypothetical protein BCR33DRAFT_713681 [Rhizoclosmatium globosum]|eukprot:ORY49310.1 hypothetical protein BCR33DRAFT_713681 [Rhizoclosmatium globosum]
MSNCFSSLLAHSCSGATPPPPPLLAAADPVVYNWTKFNVDTNSSSFYNGPPCHLAHNTLGWDQLALPDGSLFTASKRPIVVCKLTAFVFQYILEAMGIVVRRIQYILGIEFYNNIVDFEMEISCHQLGCHWVHLSYNKGIGLYFPTHLMEKYPDWNLDFWRSLLNPERRSAFPASGTGPICGGNPGPCINGTYVPKQCQLLNSSCIEMWHIDQSYSTNIYSRLIDGLELPVTINFLGGLATAFSILTDSLAKKKDILFYFYTPSTVVATNNLTKVLFPSNNPTEYSAFTKDRSKPLTTDPESIILQKLMSPRFAADFPEISNLATRYQIDSDSMTAMLKRMGGVPAVSAPQAACEWIQQNQQTWTSWVPPVPTSVVSCPVGQGRYLIGASYACISCPKDTYNWNTNNTKECTACPDNFDCPGGSTVNVLEGLWMPAPTGTSPVSYVCPLHDSCCNEHSCPPLSCAPQFKGTLCTECDTPGQYLWGGTCHYCGAGGGLSFYATIIIAFICAFGLLLLPYEEAPTVELLFFYFQVARYTFESQVNGILKVPGISTFLAITSLNVDGFVSDCPLPIAGIQKLLFRFFLPTLILAYIVLIYFGLRSLQTRFPRVNEVLMRYAPYHLRGESVSLICFRAVIIVLTFIVMPLVDSSLMLLQCTTIEGKYVLSQVPQVECFGSQHAPAAALAIIIIIIMLGALPVLLGFTLYKLNLNNQIKYEDEGLTPIQKLFQCLYIIFKPEMYYMMPITILEKGVVSILFAMMAKYDNWVQTNTYIMALTVLCGTRIYWQPFANHLEAYLNREIALGILAMIALRQYTDAYGVTPLTLIEIGIAIFLPPCFHLMRWTRENYHKHKDTIHQALSKAGSSLGSKSTRSQTQSTTISQTASAVNQQRSKLGLKGSVDKLNIGTRSTLRSGNLSRKPSLSPTEVSPLNPDRLE